MRARVLVAASFATLVAASYAQGANPPSSIARVDRVVRKLKPFQVDTPTVPQTGRTYVCRWYDDAPSRASADFTWQVRVCRVQKAPGHKS